MQGVGFRPFIFLLANNLQLTGWVRNCMGTVEIHVQGMLENIEKFIVDLAEKKPPLSQFKLETNRSVGVKEFNKFSILESQAQGDSYISVPGDLFLCDECLAELNDPSNRRYRYPFNNCTQCGPRYTIIQRLPYDRVNTTMAGFKLCDACRSEYENPRNRRFHAEPIACADCGPSLTFHDDVTSYSKNEDALKHAIEVLRNGKVLAVKGIGGYHLMCDASSKQAVTRLREHKLRPDKPLAVMFPAPKNEPFKYVDVVAEVSDLDKLFLVQPSRPMLLVKKKSSDQLSEKIAPGLNEMGVMLPYSPLHHLLLNDFSAPLVATSANISGEPVLIESEDVEQRLAHVADAFLHHDRTIERPADDPVFRMIAGKPRAIRIGRGSAPMELSLPFYLKQPVLAVGAHMKNVIVLAWENRAVMSAHIGEMDSARSLQVFENTIKDFQKLYGVTANTIICDAHPGYSTTRWAKKQACLVHHVYHHHAHAAAAYYECHTDEKVMAFSWDGVGYGEGGDLWGGEAFVGRPEGWQHVASMRPFYLPGGDRASREPWRSAAAVSWQTGMNYDSALERNSLVLKAWQKKINSPKTTSVGRLFDAAAALTGLRDMCSFEGQAAMEFESMCESIIDQSDDYVELKINNTDHLLVTDWEPLFKMMLNDSLSVQARARLFHASLAQSILEQAKIIRELHGVNDILFSGGVFQNRVLTEYAMTLLSNNDFKVCLPELIPINDAGISFGQVMEYGFNKNN